ncbi:unnamed protein product [Polarella glacialis]|uniref:Uncharacterized protein n=1 Tax=Polarella glacialis TaxID=89957 RepID=A0A813G8K7_POLGL|nr:unnamed protein product [Polarella glacialis]
MEPVSILLATVAIAVYANHRAKQISKKARLVTLPELLAATTVDDGATVQVLAVHVLNSSLNRQLLGNRLKVRVKYGDPGVSIHCDTAEAVASAPAPSPAARYAYRLHRDQSQHHVEANFGTTCIFHGQPESWHYTENLLRFQVMKHGLVGRTVARAELRVSALNMLSTWSEYKMQLEGPFFKGSHILGQLDIALETRVMPKGGLRQYLSLLGAQQQQEAFLIPILPVAEGEVTQDEASSSADDEAIVKGQYITAPPKVRRFLGCISCGRQEASEA